MRSPRISRTVAAKEAVTLVLAAAIWEAAITVAIVAVVIWDITGAMRAIMAAVSMVVTAIAIMEAIGVIMVMAAMAAATTIITQAADTGPEVMAAVIVMMVMVRQVIAPDSAISD